eukprot:scaffold204077_cov17-Tisochrysis_lutea.AAC.2
MGRLPHSVPPLFIPLGVPHPLYATAFMPWQPSFAPCPCYGTSPGFILHTTWGLKLAGGAVRPQLSPPLHRPAQHPCQAKAAGFPPHGQLTGQLLHCPCGLYRSVDLRLVSSSEGSSNPHGFELLK